MRDVVGPTLEEDAAEGATKAMEQLTKGQVLNSGVTGTRIAPEISDPEIMKYALKGSDEDWANALKEKGGGVDEGTIQIKSTKVKTPKRKADDDALESAMKNEKALMSGKKAKSSKKKSKRKSH